MSHVILVTFCKERIQQEGLFQDHAISPLRVQFQIPQQTMGNEDLVI